MSGHAPRPPMLTDEGVREATNWWIDTCRVAEATVKVYRKGVPDDTEWAGVEKLVVFSLGIAKTFQAQGMLASAMCMNPIAVTCVVSCTVAALSGIYATMKKFEEVIESPKKEFTAALRMVEELQRGGMHPEAIFSEKELMTQIESGMHSMIREFPRKFDLPEPPSATRDSATLH